MISKRISDLMTAQGISRAELGRLTGIPYHRLNPWFIRPGAKPNGPDLQRVAKALGVSVNYLIYGDEPDRDNSEDWIFQIYHKLDPARQKQMRDFLAFLASQKDDPEEGPGGSPSDR